MGTKKDNKTFFEHIDELRKIVIHSLVAIIFFSIVAYFFKEKIMEILVLPLGQKLVFLSVSERIIALIKLSLITGLILAFPYIIYQIWDFVSNLFSKEAKSRISKYILVSILLFYGAILFCYFFVLPTTLKFLTNFGDIPLVPSISLENYLDFVLYFLLAFGLVFQFPLMLLILINLNVVSVNTLRKNRAYFIVGIFIIAAIVTPSPDAFSQIILALPLVLLFEITLLVARFNKKEN